MKLHKLILVLTFVCVIPLALILSKAKGQETPAPVIFGCHNDPSSKCLDIGSANENPSGIYLSKRLLRASPKGYEYIDQNVSDMFPGNSETYSTWDYKSFVAQFPGTGSGYSLKEYRISFDSFGNLGDNGFPIDDYLLEIHYKDVYRNDGTSFAYGQRLLIESAVNYGSLGSDTIEIGKLLGTGNNEWRYEQIYLPKNNLQKIRAVDGKFIFTLKEFRTIDNRVPVPIDYISLKKLTNDDAKRFTDWQKSRLGRLDYTETNSLTSFDEDYTWYSVPSMKPIYPNQVPLQTEVKKPIAISSAYSQIEPFNFGVYAKSAMSNASFRINDLALEGRPDTKLPSSKITVSKVVYSDKMWSGSGNKYGLMPDYPKELGTDETFDIGAGKSQQFWGEVTIDSNIPGGVYSGTIDIRRNDTIESIPLSVKVVPTTLAKPDYISAAYHDPTSLNSRTIRGVPHYSLYGQADTVMEDMKAHGINNIIGDLNIGFASSTDATCSNDLDYSKFEDNFNLLKSKGLISKVAVYKIAPLYSNITSVCASGKTDWWDIYRDPASMAKFETALTHVKAFVESKDTEIILIGEDEPDQQADRHMQVMVTSTIAHRVGIKIWSTYSSEASRVRNCQEKTSPEGVDPPTYSYCTPCNSMEQDFCKVNSSGIPQMDGLDPYVDYKAWAMSTINQDGRNDRGRPGFYDTFGYYTTFQSQKRSPIINRFLNGLYAEKAEGVGTKILINWAYIGEAGSDPYNDFDQNPRYGSARYRPDYLWSYPSWDGKPIPTFAMKGLREGIKDAEYLATLKELIAKHPDDATAVSAQEFLNTTFDGDHVKPRFHEQYSAEATEFGIQGVITKYLSKGLEANDENADDYEIFDDIRNQMITYIERLTTPTITVSADKTSVRSGDIITYTVTFKNIADKALSNLQLEAPVPKNTRYIANSASGDGVFEQETGKVTWRPAVGAGEIFQSTFRVRAR